jgi:hypothetical protein
MQVKGKIHHEGVFGPHFMARIEPDEMGPRSKPEKIYRFSEVD